MGVAPSQWPSASAGGSSSSSSCEDDQPKQDNCGCQFISLPNMERNSSFFLASNAQHRLCQCASFSLAVMIDLQFSNQFMDSVK